MKKRNKKYRPRNTYYTGLNLIHKVIYRGEPLAEDQITDLGLANWIAYDRMVKGDSTEYDWNAVTGALNMGMVLCERGIGKEYSDIFKNALDGTFRAKLRGLHKGIWRYDGDAIAAIKTALEVHDEQCKLISRAEMIDTIQNVMTRIEQGNIYKVEQ